MNSLHRCALAALCALCLVFALAAEPAQRQHKPFGSGGGEACRADSLTGFDVQSYAITLSINQAAHTVSGNVLATVLAEENLSSLQYELVGLSVSSVLVNGSPAAYTHSDGVINIGLNIQSGQTFSTQVFYSGSPQLSNDLYHIGMIFSSNTVFTISDPDAARYWWPCYDHPWDKAVVDLAITLRSDWKVAANGLRTQIVDNGDGTSTTHWEGQHPMTTYLVCITCGPYQEINQTAGALPIQNFVMQNQYNNALTDLANVPEMIDYFSSVFGPYPFEKYGHAVVSMSTYGAMEHQTMTTLGNYIINGTGSYEPTIAHELAHQWYGNAVSFLTFKDVWLSEGFATYSEHLWTDHRFGWASAVAYLAANFHQYYLNWEASNGPQTIYNPAFNSYFAPTSYEKAASVLHMLRLKLGNANFFQLLNQWFTANSGGNVVTAEFQALAEQIGGIDLDQFFHQWVYSAGIPALEYSVWSRPEGEPSLKITTRTVSNTATDFQIEVPFRLANGAINDSLLVTAGPDWSENSNLFSNPYSDSSILTANHNHWALLRSTSEIRPVLTECLPSDSAVLLSWEDFLGMETPAFYRRETGETVWTRIYPEAAGEFSCLDTTVQNGVSYEYCFSALDEDGYFSQKSNSLQATPVEFSFANALLVVDETRDGNGANINPNDAMVDDFYSAALSPIPYQNWDCASQGLPPLEVLGQYRAVLWHADDFSQNDLLSYQNTLGGYLLGGGRTLISGWKTAGVLSGAFLERYFGDFDLVYDNSACLMGAQSQVHPDLAVDPLKLFSAWNGMLPYVYTFSGAEQAIYTAEMGPAGAGNGNPAALWQQPANGSGELILFGFPLYFMQAEGVRAALQEIVPQLLSHVANADLALPSRPVSLSAWPNPFNPVLSLSYYLPQAGQVKLGLYNLKGQLVRDLDSGFQPAGERVISCEARGPSGEPLSSGVYLLRLETGKTTLVKRISLVK